MSNTSAQKAFRATKWKIIWILCSWMALYRRVVVTQRSMAKLQYQYLYMITCFRQDFYKNITKMIELPSAGLSEAVTLINRMLERGIGIEDLPDWVTVYGDLLPSHWAYTDVIEASNGHLYDRYKNGVVLQQCGITPCFTVEM